MASTSRSLRKSVEDAEIFQVLEEKKKFDNKTFFQGNKRQFFQLHKSYENAIGTRNVQLWHYKGKQKKMANRIQETNCPEIEEGRVQDNAA